MGLVLLFVIALLDAGVILGILAILQGTKSLPRFQITLVVALVLAIANALAASGCALTFGRIGVLVGVLVALLINGGVLKLAFALTWRETLFMLGMIFVYWVIRSPVTGPVVLF